MSRTYRTNRKTGKRERDTYHRGTHAVRSCTHHGGCPYCTSGRLFAQKRQAPVTDRV